MNFISFSKFDIHVKIQKSTKSKCTFLIRRKRLFTINHNTITLQCPNKPSLQHGKCKDINKPATLQTKAHCLAPKIFIDVLLNGLSISAKGELSSLCCMMGKTMSLFDC